MSAADAGRSAEVKAPQRNEVSMERTLERLETCVVPTSPDGRGALS